MMAKREQLYREILVMAGGCVDEEDDNTLRSMPLKDLKNVRDMLKAANEVIKETAS